MLIAEKAIELKENKRQRERERGDRREKETRAQQKRREWGFTYIGNGGKGAMGTVDQTQKVTIKLAKVRAKSTQKIKIKK